MSTICDECPPFSSQLDPDPLLIIRSSSGYPVPPHKAVLFEGRSILLRPFFKHPEGRVGVIRVLT
jgi:hypothetical protein